MTATNLWGIVLPKPTNVLGKTVPTLAVDSDDKPAVKSLELTANRVVTVELLDPKPGTPSTILIPVDQIAYMVPMPKDQDKAYQLFIDDEMTDGLAAANAASKASRDAGK